MFFFAQPGFLRNFPYRSARGQGASFPSSLVPAACIDPSASSSCAALVVLKNGFSIEVNVNSGYMYEASGNTQIWVKSTRSRPLLPSQTQTSRRRKGNKSVAYFHMLEKQHSEAKSNVEQRIIQVPNQDAHPPLKENNVGYSLNEGQRVSVRDDFSVLPATFIAHRRLQTAVVWPLTWRRGTTTKS